MTEDKIQSGTNSNEVCSIRIMFPINNDEQAVEIKKKIKDILSNIPEVQTQFTLTTLPKTLNKNALPS